MLQLKQIRKEYKTGDLIQTALDGVTLNLRDNEFVAVLGPSGSGKTTLLNIIGGLDRYDSGELIINNISTKRYNDRDWDSYRNHTIGFVFQSYNLIPHQSVLANVELALTISGISGNDRRERAKKALEKVGLGDQLHKRPNQMSGGQMQRVAIARALVNDPDILLADEPTGALDTDTSMQVMELLKEVAKDRLVVMVTHNPELAEKYATRIVKLRDGRIIDDSDTYEIEKTELKEPQHRNMGKSSMSFKTALSLSFNNLRTKKARTLLTSFAGSIGIIGIALILAISTGVNTYISDLQKSTMTSYPISIEAQSMDLSSMLAAGRDNTDSAGEGADHEKDAVYSDGSSIEMASSITTSITENNLTKFKEYLESDDCDITQYVGENGIAYSYDTAFSVYAHDPDGILVNTDGSTLDDSSSKGAGGMNMMSGMSSMMSSGSNNFEELMPGTEGNLISDAITDNYELLYGEWANSYDEVVLVLDKNNEISSTALYELGILPSSEYKEILQKIEDGQEVALDTRQWSYEEICSQELYMIPACDLYQENENGLFEKIGDTDSEIESLLSSAIKLKITGIIRPAEDAENALISESIGYTSALTEYLIDYTNNSAVVQAQQASPDNNVLNGAEFSPADDAAKIADTKNYLNRLSDKEKADMCREILQSAYSDDPNNAQMMQNMTDAQLSATLDRYVLGSGDTENERLLSIYDTYISSGSYDDNMTAFGYVSPDAPAGINIYVDSFEDKEAITDCIDDYNKTVAEEDQISYTDYVGLLMSSVTTIVNVISYVLIAFVAVSLVVSSIMIGIITYISVLERTKEIGILRAIGASKRNISQVFNAETFIVGLCSGLIGIGITLLLLIPGNAIIHSLTGAADINAVLPIGSAVLLIVLSVILTLIGGFIPSKKAAKKDPVAALRAE
jgi:putative ABC transport system permease protein